MKIKIKFLFTQGIYPEKLYSIVKEMNYIPPLESYIIHKNRGFIVEKIVVNLDELGCKESDKYEVLVNCHTDEIR